MVLHLLLAWEFFSVCKSAFLTILFWTLHFMPRTEKQIKYHSKALDAHLKRRIQAYPICLQYCPLNIANKAEVQYDSFIMYTELYHFLPQASLPLSQMYSSHLLITMINLLSADQNLILLTHWACSKCVSYTRILATADYYACLYFWNMHSRLPQANPYNNPAAWLQEAGSGTTLPCRDCLELKDPPGVWCGIADFGDGGLGAWTLWACFAPCTAAHGWAGTWEKLTPRGPWRLLYILVQSSFLSFIESFWLFALNQ